jgi:hypothetical protein
MIALFAILSTLFLATKTRAREHPQFCVQDDVFSLDLRLAASRHVDANSSLHILFSGRFDHGVSWAAFGPGTKMDNTLMFLVYPSASDEGE